MLIYRARSDRPSRFICVIGSDCSMRSAGKALYIPAGHRCYLFVKDLDVPALPRSSVVSVVTSRRGACSRNQHIMMNKPPLYPTTDTRTSDRDWQYQEEESATLLLLGEKVSVADRRRTLHAQRIITSILPWFFNAIFLTSAVIYFMILQPSSSCPYPKGSVCQLC